MHTHRKRVSELKQTYEDKVVIVGVDRLDYIKGIPQKLQGLELFFETNPEWIGKIVLIQVAVPSREDVEVFLLRYTIFLVVFFVITPFPKGISKVEKRS